MITISRERSGALTKITAVCSDAATADHAFGLFEYHGRVAHRDDLTIHTTCKRQSAENLVDALERIATRPAAPAPSTTNSKRRELILANIISENLARAKPGFSGFGAEFTGTEIHGDMWGETVRYAYYN